MRTVRGSCLLVAAASAAALLLPTSASASFHLTKISEVSPGTSTPGSAFIELQAYAGGQNLLATKEVTIYDGTGPVKTVTLDNVTNAQSQRTVLIGGSALPNGITPDFELDLNPFLEKAGGAVCFEALDCVSWGATSAVLPSPAGAPVAASGGIPNGSSIARSIARGCATLLEAGDDTNDSAADFALTTDTTPRPNSETPREKSCGGGPGPGPGGSAPQTSIDKGPKKKTAKKTAKFRFSSPDAGANFECSLDGKDFKPCESPLKLRRIKPGKHVFSVRAVLDGKADKSPAEYRWKRVRKK